MSATQDLKDAAALMAAAAKKSQTPAKRPAVEAQETIFYRGYFGDTLFEGTHEDLRRFCKDHQPDFNPSKAKREARNSTPRNSHQASKCALNLVDCVRRLENEIDQLKMNSGRYYDDSQQKLEGAEATTKMLLHAHFDDNRKIEKAKSQISRLKTSIRKAEQKGYDRGLLVKRQEEVDKGVRMTVVREFLSSPVYSQIMFCRESKLLGDGARVTIEQLKHLNHLPADFSEPLLDPYKNGDLTALEEDQSQEESSCEDDEFSEILDEVELGEDDLVEVDVN